MLIDLWLAAVAMVVGALLLPIWASKLSLPRSASNVEFELESPDLAQKSYERRVKVRDSFRVGIVCLSVYFLIRALVTDPKSLPLSMLDSVAPLQYGLGAFVLGLGIGRLIRYFAELHFVSEFPQFENGFLPVKARILDFATFAFAIGLLCVSFAENTFNVAIFCLALAVFVVGRRLLAKSLLRMQIDVAAETPLAIELRSVAEKIGVAPKRYTLMPSLMTNAYARPDHSVVLTTSLVELLSPEEAAGVVAHEMSHVKDRDPRKIQLGLLVTVESAALITFATCACLSFLGVRWALIVPLVWTLPITIVMIGNSMRTRVTRRMEFKCDAAVAQLGRGRDLGEALKKIHLFMGVPFEWRGLDRYLLTHPSLNERLAALGAPENQ